MAVVAHEPLNAQEAAALLAAASSAGTPIVIHGNRTKLGCAATEGVAALSTRQLTAGLEHYEGDLVATAPAGCTLRDVNAALAAHRQWIPLDPPFADTATIGGIVATNDSGPRRHRFGSPRDLIIGIEVALANGTIAHSGGRVVKNVAGYDLGRLFCGSLGSLGLITRVTFKLAPMAAASRTVVARFDQLRIAAASALLLDEGAGHTPSTLEIVAPGPRLLVRYETTTASAERMADLTASILRAAAREVTVLEAGAEAAVWADHQRIESTVDGIAARMAVLPADMPQMLVDLERLASDAGVTWSATGRAAIGVLHVNAIGDAEPLGRFAAGLRDATAAHHGHAEFIRGEAHLPSGVPAMPPVGTASAIGLAVKQRFDPGAVLPYPWGS
jgi:glycolate oxidase FAD binding subunit